MSDELRKRLDAIKARLSKATPGPWREGTLNVWDSWGPGRGRGTRCIARTRRGWYKEGTFTPFERTDSWDQMQEDAAFIAHAPDDIAWLINQIEQRRE